MKARPLRKLMQKNRVFLHLLYSDTKKNTTHRLNLCTNVQAKLVLHILHDIINGVIPLKAGDAKALKKTKRIKILQRIESKDNLRDYLGFAREDKVSFLKQFTALYPLFFRSIFEE